MLSLCRAAGIVAIVFMPAVLTIETSCIKRSFNNVSQKKRAEINPKRIDLQPLTVQEFEEALYSGAREALKFFSSLELNSFFDEAALEGLRSSRRNQFLDALAYQFPLAWSLSRVNSSPVWVSRTGSGSIPDGGMVLLGRDLFPEGYFRVRAGSLALTSVMTQAPWFEWDDAEKVFHPRRGGSPERILSGLFALRGESQSFTLFRGAGLQLNTFAPPTRNPYDSGQPESGELMYFSSPSLNTALTWARPAVWKSEIPRAELLAGVVGRNPSIYVGFEYHYPEIAFLRTNAAQPLLLEQNRSELLCVSNERQKFSDSEPPPSSDGKPAQPLRMCNPKWLSAQLSGFPEPAVAVKKAVVKSDARIKMTPVREENIQEGLITCGLKTGTVIEYSLAYEVAPQQIWIHSTGVDVDWGCPRSFSSTNFYIDAEKVSVTLSK